MKWNKELETGNTTIDEHHQELFRVISLLDKAIKEHNENRVEEVIEFLEHYVRDHFKEEETLMQKSNFEFYQEHKDEHEFFVKEVLKIRSEFNNQNPIAHSILNIRRFIDRLVLHIRTIDIKMAHLER